MDYKLDMSVMLAIHQALRRDLERLGRIAAKPDGDPGRLLRAAAASSGHPTTLPVTSGRDSDGHVAA